MPSSMILKESIFGTLGEPEASFMACLLSCSRIRLTCRSSGEGSEKTDLNWPFSMVAFHLIVLGPTTLFGKYFILLSSKYITKGLSSCTMRQQHVQDKV